jgi:hypothetical protein
LISDLVGRVKEIVLKLMKPGLDRIEDSFQGPSFFVLDPGLQLYQRPLLGQPCNRQHHSQKKCNTQVSTHANIPFVH